MTNESTTGSVDEYIAGFPEPARTALEELRAVVRVAAPGATERISYAMPTFDLNGRLVYFAGYARHIGFYPTGGAIEAFRDEIEPFKSGKGSIQFQLEQPLPTDLIRRIVEFRVRENSARPA